MKKFKLLLIFIAATQLFVLNLNAQPMNLSKKWKEVDEKISTYPQQALKIIDEIYDFAQKNNLNEEIIKCQIYRLKALTEQEDYFETEVVKMEKYLEIAPEPNKSMMYSILAKLYWQYFEYNKWTISKRTKILNQQSDDIRTWTAEDFAEKVVKYYNLSIANAAELQKIDPKYYVELIYKGTKPAELRPTLYDFLVAEAINFFSNSTINITRPIDYFQIIDDVFFADAQTFVNTQFVSSDTLSFQYNCILIFQKWLKFRLSESQNVEALIDADIQRLNYVYKFSVNPDKDNYYIEALKRVVAVYPNAQQTGYAWLYIADYYKQKAQNYSPADTNTSIFRYYYKKAIELYNKIKVDYPKDSELYGRSQNAIYDIEAKQLSFTIEENVVPKNNFALLINYCNVDKITLDINRISYEDYKNVVSDNRELTKVIITKNSLVKSYNIELTQIDDYQTHSTEFIVDKLEVGQYLITIRNNATNDKEKIVVSQVLQVTDIALIYQNQKNQVQGIVVDRQTSDPIANAKVELFRKEYDYNKSRYVQKSVGVVFTDNNGIFTYVPNDNYYSFDFEVSAKNQKVFFAENAYLSKVYDGKVYKPIAYIYTDRAIYRPGQTVYFKGILIEHRGEERKILTKNQFDVQLYDVNWQVVATQKLTTNEYGTFTGLFTLPTGVLNGKMTIYTPYGSHTIQVEEYKRPQFYVEMQPVDKQYLVNDVVVAKGFAQNYSGVKLNDAIVSYKVVRKNIWRGWWWWNYHTQEVMIAIGTTKTDENGEFQIQFKAVPDLTMPRNENTSFNYFIYVDVTDLNGETQSTSSVVNIGYTSMIVNIQVANKISTEEIKDKKSKIKINATNLSGKDVYARGTIEIFSLVVPKTPLRKRQWLQPDVYSYTQQQWYELYPNNEYRNESDYRFWDIDKNVFNADFDTKTKNEFNLADIRDLKDGVYKIIAKSKDEFGNPVMSEQFFVVFTQKSNSLPYTTYWWINELKTTCQPNENAQILIGSSKKVKILYQLYRGNDLLEQSIIPIDNSQKLIEIPIKEQHRGGLSVLFTFAVDNSFCTEKININIPYTNKELKLEFETFRDKLQPGQQETYKIKILNIDGEPQMAELLTTMYDASLDAIIPNNWSFSIYPYNYTSIFWNSNNFDNQNSTTIKSFESKYHSYTVLNYSSLNLWGFYYFRTYERYNRLYYQKAEPMNGHEEGKIYEEAPVPTNDKKKNGNDVKSEEEDKQQASTQVQEVQIRKNFNETAFFYPTLQTNDKGDVSLTFTIPEALTRWRFLGLAHTKDLKYGLFDKSLVTQKQLMVMPNSPRFFRQGDTVVFSTKISNLTDKDLSGLVSIEFFDDLSDQKLSVLAPDEASSKQFYVGNGLSTSVSWKLVIPYNAKTITYKVIARAENFSDGEQKLIPVLTNRMLVTEALPLNVRANQTREFSFEKLLNSQKSKTLVHERLTVEFTSNPAWLAIQALPYLIEYPWECSEQTFARYYANSLASYIVNTTPRIKTVFETWKNFQPSALLSNLEKNQELKQVFLEETPWVLEAKNENQRKQRIAVLFDLNRMSNELNAAFEKLRKEQTVNGGWPWFKGMPESWYITQYIAEGFGHLAKIGVVDINDTKIDILVSKAVQFIDKEMFNLFDYIQKEYTNKQIDEYIPSSLVMHYLYTRSYFPQYQLDRRYTQARDYFYNQTKKYWNKMSIYNQGMAAIVFHRNKETKLANDILQSLREKAVMNEELGMYWKELARGYYWYEAPIESQALMIEAFWEIAKDTKSCDEMIIWLLKNKQTNDWQTTTATAKAIYALLLPSSGKILDNTTITPVQIGDLTINPSQNKDIETEAGTGYYKVSYTANQIKPQMGNIKVINTNNIVNWGAVYWQYWEDLDKITPHATQLSIKKDLFIEVQTNQGTRLQPITAKTPIKVGDKIIVRIEIRTDRDMEYVHLKDMRASGFEPTDIISKYRYQDGLGYYQTTKDASTNFFIDRLPRGTYVFQYALRANIEGNFSNGITTIQCMYAPEFTSHSQGIRVEIKR